MSGIIAAVSVGSNFSRVKTLAAYPPDVVFRAVLLLDRLPFKIGSTVFSRVKTLAPDPPDVVFRAVLLLDRLPFKIGSPVFFLLLTLC